MPFTFAHPSIVLFLKRLSPRFVSMSGLIMGSMLPDFEYFFRLVPISTVSHTLKGIFSFDLPLGVILLLIYHVLVRNRLIENLPTFLFKRFGDYKKLDWIMHCKQNIIQILVSLLIGIASHIIWDSFTHELGFSVLHFPILSENLPLINYPAYKLLQHGSTLLGFCFVAYFILKLPQKSGIIQNKDKFYWLCFILLFLIILPILVYSLPSLAIGRIVVTSISASLLSITILSLFYRISTPKDKSNSEFQ